MRRPRTWTHVSERTCMPPTAVPAQGLIVERDRRGSLGDAVTRALQGDHPVPCQSVCRCRFGGRREGPVAAWAGGNIGRHADAAHGVCAGDAGTNAARVLDTGRFCSGRSRAEKRSPVALAAWRWLGRRIVKAPAAAPHAVPDQLDTRKGGPARRASLRARGLRAGSHIWRPCGWRSSAMPPPQGASTPPGPWLDAVPPCRGLRAAGRVWLTLWASALLPRAQEFRSRVPVVPRPQVPLQRLRQAAFVREPRRCPRALLPSAQAGGRR